MIKLLVTLLLGALLAMALIAGKNRNRFRYRPGALDAAAYAQLGTRARFVTDVLGVAPGVELRGLIRRPLTPTGTWLLFLPGNGDQLLEGAQNLLARFCDKTGFGAAVWSYRGFDGSGGDASLRHFAGDSETAWNHLRTKFGAAPERIHLVAFSLGTALALRLAARSTANGGAPASIVLLSPYDVIVVAPNTWWSPWAFGDRYDAVEFAGASKMPVLLVHGALDDAVPISAGRNLAQALGARARLLELPGRGHVDWLGDESVAAQVREFLLQHTPR